MIYMLVDTNNLVSITEANQNFSKVARMVDESGTVVILKNNVPKYVLQLFDEADEYVSDDEMLALSAKLIEKNKLAYEVLAR